MRIEGASGFVPQGSEPTTYRTQEGDTLGSVANDFQISAELLAKTNSIEPNAILTPGIELIIPEQTQLSVPQGLAGVQDQLEKFTGISGEHSYIVPELGNFTHNYIGPELSSASHNYIAPELGSGDHSYISPELGTVSHSYIGPELGNAQHNYIGPELAA
ncbi:MAG: hypothetical protein C5B54_04385, partial [Acidobacteria bacterium]